MVDYKCSLSEETLEVAKLELREDEAKREHAVEQLREWINKHPSIKRCRTDTIFLLKFLRVKKFSVPMAQEVLEKYLKARQLNPELFRDYYIDNPDIEAVIDAGYLLPLPQRDSLGRVILLGAPGRFDPHKHTQAQAIQVHYLALDVLLEDEETQVNGIVHVYDQAGFNMGHVTSWTLPTMRRMMLITQKAIPGRYKEIHMLNLPGVANKFMEILISMLSKKLRSRVKLHRTVADLHKFVDPKILPKEYGGEVPLSEMIAEYKKLLHEKRDVIKALDDMHIEILQKDLDKTSEDLCGGLAGSFRKLEVD